MATEDIDYKSQRLTQKQKDANDKAWYKKMLDRQHAMSFTRATGLGGVSNYRRMKINYDLFNNILNPSDFEYVCQPYGAQVGELPATMTNRDIISGKIKVMLGMEMKRPFSWKVLAVNEDATTRKEEAEFGKMREFVVNSVMTPLKKQLMLKQQEEIQGRQLTPEEKKQMEQQLEQELEAQTPDEVRKYMRRKHQDPAEALSHQLLEYLIKKEEIPEKFNKGWKHSLIAGPDVYWVGIIRDEPAVKVINPLRFDYNKSPDLDRIEEGQWASAEFMMSLSEVVAAFELAEDEHRELENGYPYGGANQIIDTDWTFTENIHHTAQTIRVVHHEWKSERKVGFLNYRDPETGDVQMDIVMEDYKLNKDAGDIDIEWIWVPEKHEGYKIGKDIYKNMRPVPGQSFDLDNLYNCPLSYIGAAHDDMNSSITCPMDRMKGYQYYYDIIMYRIELLMASDKGKLLMMNINAVPKSAGIDVAKWMYYADAAKIVWANPSEEGNKNAQDVTQLAKEIDMSLASDIQKYVELAGYIEERCGNSVGITKQMEGQIGPNDAVTNTKQNMIQSSHILEPYFELHNTVKRNVLQQLLDVAKVAYTMKKPKKLSYVLDDMSTAMLNIDPELLANSTYGLFVSNSSKAFEAKQMVEGLAQAAMQNQAIDLSDVIKVIRTEGIQEAEEALVAGEDKKQYQKMQEGAAQQQGQAQQQKAMMEHEKEKWKHEADMIVLKEGERRKTELQKQAMLSVGFDPNKDSDSDGEPDVLEIYKHGLDVEIKSRQQKLAEDKFAYGKEHDKEKIALEKEKIAATKQKNKK